MSGCSESDADRFQRASAAAGQICWDFSVGLGLGQEAFGRYGTPSMYSVFAITEFTAHTFCTSHDPLFRVFFQASPFSKPLFFMPVTLYTSCFLSFCLQTCFASSLVRVPVFAALSCFAFQSCECLESVCASYECIMVLCSAYSQKFRKGEMNGFLTFLIPPHQGLHLLLFLLPSLEDTFPPLKALLLFWSIPFLKQVKKAFAFPEWGKWQNCDKPVVLQDLSRVSEFPDGN